MSGEHETVGIIEHAEAAVKYLFTAIVAIIAWVSNRQIKRVDDIDKNYVSTEVLNNTVESLRNDIKGIHSRLDNFIDKR